jgi:hypothetical protein
MQHLMKRLAELTRPYTLTAIKCISTFVASRAALGQVQGLSGRRREDAANTF